MTDKFPNTSGFYYETTQLVVLEYTNVHRKDQLVPNFFGESMQLVDTVLFLNLQVRNPHWFSMINSYIWFCSLTQFYFDIYIKELFGFHEAIFKLQVKGDIIFNYETSFIFINIREGAGKFLARHTSPCRMTQSVASLERGVCSCVELQVFSCYGG
jgi:hypothetical protein